MGKMVFTVIAAVAELERALIQERVKAGVDRAKKQGKRLGRPRALVDEIKLCEQLEQRWSLGAIARHHGIAENAGVTLQLLAKRCMEGLDAMETKFFQYEGRVIESRDVVNFGERRKIVELCCHLKGLFPATRVDVNPGKTLEELLTGTYGD